jgi:hypothetical protein
MTKKFYDIVPRDHRSIRDIPLDVTRAPESKKEHYFDTQHKEKKKKVESVKHKKDQHIPIHVDTEVYEPEINEESFEDWNGKRRVKYIWIIAVILFLVLVYSTFSWLSSATITIVPVRHHITLQKTKIALKDIPNELVEFDITESTTTPSGGLVDTHKKASGTIVLYNTYSASAQKINVGTPLLTPSNLVYKTLSTVTIPGYTSKSGKTIPGSIEVKIEAEKSGDAYNTKFADFNIQSYKGTKMFDKIYGRSKTELMGGIDGKVPNVSKEVIASSTEYLKTKVASSTEIKIQELVKKIKPELVYVPGLQYVVPSDVVQSSSNDGKQLTFSKTSHVVLILLNKKSLSEQIIKENPPSSKESLGGRVKFNVDVATLKGSTQLDLDVNSIKKNLVYLFFSGETNLISVIDEKTITSAVSGLSKSQALKVIPDLVETESIKISSTPSWVDVLPLNRGKIKVISQ